MSIETNTAKPASEQEVDLQALDQASGGQSFGGQPQTIIVEEGGRHHHHHHHHDFSQTVGEVAAVLGAVAGTAAAINSIAHPRQPYPQQDRTAQTDGSQPVTDAPFQGN